MKVINLLIFLSLSLNLFSSVLPHQGRILISGSAYDGLGSFRFALVDQTGKIVWNHEGGTEEPKTDLTIDVENGFYQCRLGDTSINGMAELPDSLFDISSPLKLRIWFNDGTNGYQQLGLDQNLMISAYSITSKRTESEKIAMRLADEIVVQAGVSQISVDDLLKRISAFAKQATSEGKITREMLPETVLSDLEESLSVAKRVTDSGILDANGNVSQDSNFSSIDTEIPTFSRSYIIGRSSQDENAIKEINLPEVSRNKGREIIVETDMNLLIHAQDNQIELSKDMLLLSATPQAVLGITLVSDGKQWKTIGASSQRNDSLKKFYNRHSKVAVIDINKGKGDSDPSNFTLFKESVYFQASTVEHGSELWVTDGTKEGTRMIKDIVPGAQSSSPKDFYVLESAEDTLFFRTQDIEWWRSDGTTSGTSQVNDDQLINFLNYHKLGKYFTKEGSLYARDENGNESLVTNRLSGGNSFEFKGETFFAGTSTTGTELWKTNGDDSSTVIVKEIYDGTYSSPWSDEHYQGSGSPSNFFVHGDSIYFSARNRTNGMELWKSDGTTDGTVLLKDIDKRSGYSDFSSSLGRDSYPRDFLLIGDQVHFLADDANGTSLWKTDGTSEGTVISNIAIPWTLHSGIHSTDTVIEWQISSLDHKLLFSGKSPYGNELHVLDLRDYTVMPESLPTRTVGTYGPNNFKMLWVAPGTFKMGGARGDPLHLVTLTKGYFLSKYEITEQDWASVMASIKIENGQSSTPISEITSSRLPKTGVSLAEIKDFLDYLNTTLPEDSPWEYNLPTEAQWEYACRAGTTTNYSWGDEADPDFANYKHSFLSFSLKEVGQYPPNAWGFYDMHGNAGEMTSDVINWSFPKSGLTTDPIGDFPTNEVMMRGAKLDIGDISEHMYSGGWRKADIEGQIDLGFRIIMQEK